MLRQRKADYFAVLHVLITTGFVWFLRDGDFLSSSRDYLLLMLAALPMPGAHLLFDSLIPAGSCRAALPDALRVNANLLQTDLCRSRRPGKRIQAARTYSSLSSTVLDTLIPAGMTILVSKEERLAKKLLSI